MATGRKWDSREQETPRLKRRKELRHNFSTLQLTQYLLFPSVPLLWHSANGFAQEWGQGLLGRYLDTAS